MKAIVIDEARNVFARYSFRKATMDEIARAAHVAKSSIYHYFVSKEKIFEAIIEREVQAFFADLQLAIQREDTPQAKLRAYFDTRLRAMQKATNFYSAVLDEYFEHYAFIEKVRRKFDVQELKFLREILEGGIRTGVFDIRDLNAVLVGFRALVRGIEYYYFAVEKKLEKITEVQEALLKVLFNGILTRSI